MNNFKLIKTKNYQAKLDQSTGLLTELIYNYDPFCQNAMYKSGTFSKLCYTEKDSTPEISQRYAKKGESLIIPDNYAVFETKEYYEYSYKNTQYNANLSYKFDDEAVYVTLDYKGEELNQVGLAFDVNFIDHDQDGDWNHQFVPSCPYSAEDNRWMYYAMKRPDGIWILFTVPSICAGWRIIYDCHPLNQLQFLQRFDSRYGDKTMQNNREPLTIRISFHESYNDVVATIEKITNTVYHKADFYGGMVGTKFCCNSAEADKKLICPNGEIKILKESCFTPETEGLYTLMDKSGMYSRYYAYNSLSDMLIRTTDAIREPYHCDFNLCEGAMWLLALLIRKRFLGQAGKNEYRFFDFLKDNTMVTPDNVTDADKGKIVSFPHEHNGKKYSKYHLYKSGRIQNSVTQSEIMLEAYRVYKDDKYLTLSKEYAANLIRDHLTPFGALSTDSYGSESIDYTTVTACIFCFVDLYRELKSLGDKDAPYYYDASKKIADHLSKRGLNFPTEGIGQRHEMEDGSISCTALSLLYAYKFIENNPKYLNVAKEILELHDTWCINVPDVAQYCSSLRWWEHNWEGDADGSSINAGHAWTIWKAEADYWYAYITGDFARVLRSYNGYMTNYSKMRNDGEMYGCYTPDYLPSKPFKIKHSYPDSTDGSMPYYVWSRSHETWFLTSCIYKSKKRLRTLNATLSNDKIPVLTSGAISFERLFVKDLDQDILIKTNQSLEIICESFNKINIKKGIITKALSDRIFVDDEEGEIIIG